MASADEEQSLMTENDENKEEERNDIETSVKNIWAKKYYFLTYNVVFMFLGIFFSLPSVIFQDLISQLNISEEKMGSIYTYFAISGVIFALISGYISDKIDKMHRLMAIFCLLGAIVISLIYFINNFILMIFIWISMAAVQYFIEVSIVVFVFRAFSIDGAMLVAFYYFIATVSSSIVAPLFNAFHSNYNNYSYSMYILSSFGVFSAILLMILPTPKRLDLVKDVENIKNEIVSSMHDNNLDNIEIEYIENYKADHTKLIYVKKKWIKNYSSSLYVECECFKNPAIIREINEVCKECEISHQEKENNILYNIFIPISNAIRPYSTESMLSANVNNSYWFDFEEKYKKKKKAKDDDDDTDDLSSKKNKNVTNLFAVIGVLNLFFCIASRTTYNAYIVLVVTEYFLFSESNGFYLITTFWIGAVCGKIATIIVVKKIKPENVLLFCTFCMVINSILYLITMFVNDGAKILLYIVAFCGGLFAAPLPSAMLAFLSAIQPITGLLSALILVGEAMGRGVTALIVAYIIDATAVHSQIYIHLTISIILCLLLGTNKLIYLYFKKTH